MRRAEKIRETHSDCGDCDEALKKNKEYYISEYDIAESRQKELYGSMREELRKKGLLLE